MFHYLQLPQQFAISDITLFRYYSKYHCASTSTLMRLFLFRFIMTVARRYRDVPFHNFFHAFNVTQTLFYFLTTGQAAQILGPLEQLALVIAAICHDCDHPGLNNDFQRKAQTKIANLHKKARRFSPLMLIIQVLKSYFLFSSQSLKTTTIYNAWLYWLKRREIFSPI